MGILGVVLMKSQEKVHCALSWHRNSRDHDIWLRKCCDLEIGVLVTEGHWK